jgi:hypothetical protein
MSQRRYDSSRLPADALARSVRQTFLLSQGGDIDISSVTTLIGTTPIETNTDREDTMYTETLIPTLLEERRSLLMMKEHRKLCTARWHLRLLGISLTSHQMRREPFETCQPLHAASWMQGTLA